MAEVRLSPEARADLAGIDDWSTAQFGQDVADSYLRGFNEVFALLADHPRAGAERPEVRRAIRCFVHRRHRIFYRFRSNDVLIVRVLHHAQDARRMLRQ